MTTPNLVEADPSYVVVNFSVPVRTISNPTEYVRTIYVRPLKTRDVVDLGQPYKATGEIDPAVVVNLFIRGSGIVQADALDLPMKDYQKMLSTVMGFLQEDETEETMLENQIFTDQVITAKDLPPTPPQQNGRRAEPSIIES